MHNSNLMKTMVACALILAIPGLAVADEGPVDFEVIMRHLAEHNFDLMGGFPYMEFHPEGIADLDAWAASQGKPNVYEPGRFQGPADLNGNLTPDVSEFKVVESIINNPSHPLHEIVHEGYKANKARLVTALGGLANSVGPTTGERLSDILAAYALLGDGSYEQSVYGDETLGHNFFGSFGVVARLIYSFNGWGSLWTESAPVASQYALLPGTLSLCGDADGDGISNANEYYAQVAGASAYAIAPPIEQIGMIQPILADTANYVAAALNSLIATTPAHPLGACPPKKGWVFGRNLFYFPGNKHVYALVGEDPWPVCRALSETFSINGNAMPGTLARIDSQAEQNWIETAILGGLNSDAVHRYLWLGGSDETVEGDWRWIDGSNDGFWWGGPSGSPQWGRYSNWDAGQPYSGYDHLCMAPSGKWHANAFHRLQFGLAEFSNGGNGYEDMDANGLPDFWEFALTDSDADDDGMDDAWETVHGVTDPDTDPDADGLTNLQEFQNATDPNDADSDDDTFNDGLEVTMGSDPKNVLSIPPDVTDPVANCQAANVFLGADGTGSLAAEQVDNGSTDDRNIASMALSQSTFTCANLGANTVTLTVTDSAGNPGTCEATVTVSDPDGRCDGDMDNDGLDDAWETLHDVTDPALDPDADGLTNLQEFQQAVDPNDEDSDDDTYSDGEEIAADSNPNDASNIPPDVTDPVAHGQDVNVTLGADGTAIIMANQVNNGSTDDRGIASMALSRSTFTCANLGTNTVTLIVTDTAGNTGTCPVAVTVSDPDGRCDGDMENDGLDDAWEALHGVTNPAEDPDADGLTNLQEFQQAADPNDADSDDDTYNDGAEVSAGTNPVDAQDHPVLEEGEGEGEATAEGEGPSEGEATGSEGEQTEDIKSAGCGSGYPFEEDRAANAVMLLGVLGLLALGVRGRRSAGQ